MTLQEFFAFHPKAALGFSGGVDSSYLLYAAKAAGADVRPYFLKTPFQPRFELEDALRLARDLGTEVTVVEYDVLQNGTVAQNPENRCYYCKTALFRLLRRRSQADGYAILLDGTNASDDAGDRPGMRALREQGVLSPLRLCGLTKDEIRQRSREAGLFTWDKPAYACLATRIPAGTAIDRDTLCRVEAAEAALMDLGYSDLRVRVFHGAARIQLPRAQFPGDPAAAETLRRAVAPYFDPVLLDLKGR